MRDYDLLDRVILGLDDALRAVSGTAVSARRPYPAEGVDAPAMTEHDRHLAVGLMRVDHAGEIAAQALYRGQQWVGRSDSVRGAMRRAAEEESDHLAWCERRLIELGGRPSLLNPI